MKKQKKKITKISWLSIMIIVVFATMPSGVLIKLLVTDVDPNLVSALRYTLVFLAMSPFVIKGFIQHKKLILKNWPVILTCSLLAATFISLHYPAVALSSASFVQVIGLLSPVVFAIVSIIVTKDRISSTAFAGLLLAILGAFIVIAIPIWIGSGAVVTFGILPAILALLSVLSSFSAVYYRKMDEKGIPMTFTIGVMFFFGSIVSFAMAIFHSGPEVLLQIPDLTPTNWVVLIYLGIGITVFARIIKIKAYENIGTAPSASVDYLGAILGVVFPIIILGENLTWEMIIGGMLIIAGVILTGKQPHKNKHRHKHFHKNRFIKEHI